MGKKLQFEAFFTSSGMFLGNLRLGGPNDSMRYCRAMFSQREVLFDLRPFACGIAGDIFHSFMIMIRIQNTDDYLSTLNLKSYDMRYVMLICYNMI